MKEIIHYQDTHDLTLECAIELYRAAGRPFAGKPESLHRALLVSHSLFTAWHGSRLVGLGNAISDRSLVVYYPHLLIHPNYQRRGIGSELMRRLTARYENSYHQMLSARDQLLFQAGFRLDPTERTSSDSYRARSPRQHETR
ncbi:MAG: GNAT family N-acetyltransferase [Opitutales bacterium]|nr:GNAT family N-acetyltransferase [Opitutales bacterium]